MRSVWAEEKAARAQVVAMRARVRHSIATLAADHVACDAFMRAWYARQEAERTVGVSPATVLPFPARRPFVPAAPARRVA
jgi:hypothetical protein